METHPTTVKPAKVKYFFWLLSDWAYLGGPRLESIRQRHDVEVEYIPLDLPAVYARTGGVTLSRRSPERQKYRISELKRWRRRLGMICNIEPKFADNDDIEFASCCVIAAIGEGENAGLLANAFMKALWAEDQDICDAATVRCIVEANASDPMRIISRAQSRSVKEQYRSNTNRAVENGVFGSPAYLFKDELFWGQDRIEMLEDTIIASKAQYSESLGRG